MAMMLITNGFSPIFLHHSSSTLGTGSTSKLFQIPCRATTPHHSSIHPSNPSQFTYPNGKLSSFHVSIDYERKVEDLRQHILRVGDDSIEKLIMIDAIQRSGIGAHYEKEIDEILNQHYLKTRDTLHKNNSLHDVSLSFKLFRRQGYDIPSDVFNDFKEKGDGRFKGEELRQDIRGLMELYEAAQLSLEGEYTLDEAEDFSKKILNEYCLSDQTSHGKSKEVRMRLRHPYHKSITRLTQRNILEETKGASTGKSCRWQEALQALVEMDFQLQQFLFGKELLQVSRWWNELDLTRELKHARNQPLKWHTWSMTMLIDNISLSEERLQLSKAIAFLYLIDDIFDLHGTLDELAVFTEAINKWDHTATPMLPNYMRMSYRALLATTSDIGHVIYKNHGYNPINHLKQSWGSLCNAFLVEAKWLASNNLPRAQEYLDNAKLSSGVPMVLLHLYFLLGLGGSDESEILLNDASKFISCVATILRLSDDLGCAKDEDQDGRDGSYVACYMKENHHLSSTETREHVMKMIATQWKCLNKESFKLRNSSILSPFYEASLNLARMVPLMYPYEGNLQLPGKHKFFS